MKRKMRFTGILLMLAALVCALAVTASAEAALPETCPQCGTEATWTALSTVADDAASISAGHYYYDYADATHTWTAEKAVSGKVCIYIPEGKTLTATSRVFTVNSGGTLSLCGTGTVQAGQLTGTATTARYGGCIYVKSGGKLVLREATLTDTAGSTLYENGSNGGVVAVWGDFVMYSGYIKDGTASNAGGNIFVSPAGEFFMYGGEISGGSCVGGLKSSGASVVVQGSITLGGNATINKCYMQEKDSGPAFSEMLTVTGKYTGTANLQFASATFAEGLDLGNADGANLRSATISITSCKLYLAVDGTDLKLSSVAPGYCAHCAQVVTSWVALDESVAESTTLSAGHYYLDFAEGTDEWVQKTVGSDTKVCLDLNGQTIQGTTRVFSVSGTLSILGSGTVKGGGFTATNTNGGVATVSSTGVLNIYGGTYTAAKYGSNTYLPYNGGVVAITGSGDLNVYGGTLSCPNVGGVGGSIFAGPSAHVKLLGGKIQGESPAACIQGDITLGGNAEVDLQLRYKSGSPAHGQQLTITGEYAGVASVQFHSSITATFEEGDVIGVSDDADLVHASITVKDADKAVVPMYVVADNGDLKLSASAPTPTTKEAECPVCGKTVTWTMLTESFAGQTELGSGHYYLKFGSGAAVWEQKTVSGKTCLDLNGQTLTGSTRAFFVDTGAIFNIMGEGTVVGRGKSSSLALENRTGGTFEVGQDAVLNLYGGTLTSETVDGQKAGNGGVINLQGTMNIYGGEVKGGISSWVGGNIFVTTTGQLNLLGGSVTGGSASQAGNCIACRGSVKLAGDAKVSELYLYPNTGGPALAEMLTIEGKYTGTAKLRASGIYAGMDVGTSLGADLSEATITTTSTAAATAAIYGKDILLTGSNPFMIFNGTTLVNTYADFTSAAAALAAGDRIVLFTDVESITTDKDLYVDLNGYDVTGTVSGNGKVYFMDAFTNDYTVADGKYGTVPVGENVLALPQESGVFEDGYLMIQEAGKASFHRVNLKIKSMSFKPSQVGLYFLSDFAGDEMVKAKVETFGVALSIEADPMDAPMGTLVRATELDKETFNTGAANTSTLVYGIMKPSQTDAKNQKNANTQIYGRAYIRYTDGTEVYGALRSRSLLEQVEGTYDQENNMTQVGINGMWDGLTDDQQLKILEMYVTYKDVMDTWNIDNITAMGVNDAASLQAAKDGAKVLAERRETVIAKMRAMGDLMWVADEDISYALSTGRAVNIRKGRLYRGMLYSFARTDEQCFLTYAGAPDENGYYHISGLTDASLNEWGYDARIGTDCGGSVLISYMQIGASVSATAGPTTMVPYHGFLPVGSYILQETEDHKTGATKDVAAANGTEVIYASYAKTQPADILSTSTGTGGHSIMIIGKHIAYNADGSIDGDKSYLHTFEQTPGPISNEDHSYDPVLDQVVYTCFVEKKTPFASAFTSGYLPVTCKELRDPTAPITPATVTDSLDSSQYNFENLFRGILTTNRMIGSVTVTVTDEADTEQKVTAFGIRSSTDQTSYINNFYMEKILTEDPAVVHGGIDPATLTPGDYHCTVDVFLSSGETFTVRDFDFTVPQ